MDLDGTLPATWPHNLNPRNRDLLERVGEVAAACAERADEHDRDATFPSEDFDDLAAAGLNAATVPRAHGGLGLGPLNGDTLTLWLMTKELAKADLSLGACTSTTVVELHTSVPSDSCPSGPSVGIRKACTSRLSTLGATTASISARRPSGLTPRGHTGKRLRRG